MRWAACALAALACAPSETPVPQKRPENRTQQKSEPLIPGTPIDCGASVAIRDSVDENTEVLGVVAIARRAWAGPEPQEDGRYFAKTGLYVRPGARFELIVPNEVGDEVRIQWGDNDVSRRTARLVVNGCTAANARVGLPTDAGPDSWLIFTGGFFVKKTGCYPLIVRAGDRQERIEIGIGAPCPQ